jgi:isopentenyl phosphate kinase
MSDVIFLKLGGSLITDKTGVEQVRPDVLARLAAEIGAVWQNWPALSLSKGRVSLVLGHGSGSFGHVAGARYGTRQGVANTEQWLGFAQVSAAAARLNRLLVEALLEANVPALTVQPSASARCRDGTIIHLAGHTVENALAAGLLPVVYGDVAFDEVRGGTIISTEEVMGYLAKKIRPSWLLLAGETAGVYDEAGHLIPAITPANFEAIRPALGGSRGTDVTGGMASKVEAMLHLVQNQPGLTIRIFSGLKAGNLQKLLLNPDHPIGTVINNA